MTGDENTPRPRPYGRLRTALTAIAGGVAIAASMPPWGWWPLAFVGVAMLDRLLAGQPRRARFRRTWLLTAAWLYPSTLWMVDLTAPGFVIAGAFYAGMFGLLAVFVPPERGRRPALVGALILGELWRWSWPFGGVPLSTLAMSQARSPLAPTVRVLGSLLLVAVVAVIGVALSAALARAWRAVAVGVVVVAAIALLAAVAPRGHTVDTITVAVVQGGGKQRTRANPEQNPLVFSRVIEATRKIPGHVDLVLWPENVVNPCPVSFESPGCPLNPRNPSLLYEDDARAAIAQLARDLDTTILPGWFIPEDGDYNGNFIDVVNPAGETVSRYEKVQIVPFGEYVPFRSLVENFASEALPPREVRQGDGPAVLDTPFGRMAISISWEIFFDHRSRDGVNDGGRILLNPTNGSSYWLTMVQTQQLASSRLRALENGRWVLQAAPTGFSAIVGADGSVHQRTRISEQAVLTETVDLREGRTWATRTGHWPMLGIGVVLMAAANGADRRVRRRSKRSGGGTRAHRWW
jgi:apolipoprotein N-acyltransferase